MIDKKQFTFWLTIGIVLTLLLYTTINSMVMSFYFVTMLMPVVIATSVFFNRYLVPVFLLKSRKSKFVIYLVYMIIVSVYLELLVMILAFVILADYEVGNLGKIAGDIYLLTLILYLIVFAEGMVLSIQRLKESAKRLEEIEGELKRNEQKEISVRVNRSNVNVKLSEILWIESLGDYVKVHTMDSTHVTKEKISSFLEKLPNHFVRIHRSYLVNKYKIESYNKQSVTIGGQKLNIGRKYKHLTEEAFRDAIV